MSRRTLGSLSSFVNVNGEESLGTRVPVERTHVERQTIRMYERRQETWRSLNKDRVAAFIRLFLLTMVYGENGYRNGRQHPATSKLLKKTLAKRVIPFIDRCLVCTMDESMWPITMAHFKELDHQLAAKLPLVHAGHHWQNIVYFFKEVEKEKDRWRRLDDMEREVMEAVRRALEM